MAATTNPSTVFTTGNADAVSRVAAFEASRAVISASIRARRTSSGVHRRVPSGDQHVRRDPPDRGQLEPAEPGLSDQARSSGADAGRPRRGTPPLPGRMHRSVSRWRFRPRPAARCGPRTVVVSIEHGRLTGRGEGMAGEGMVGDDLTGGFGLHRVWDRADLLMTVQTLPS